MARPTRRIVTVHEENDILDDLENMLKQATTERSHYYVAKCCRSAIDEIKRLRRKCGERD